MFIIVAVKEHKPDNNNSDIISSYQVCMSVKLQYEYKTCMCNIDPGQKSLPGASSNRPSVCLSVIPSRLHIKCYIESLDNQTYSNHTNKKM